MFIRRLYLRLLAPGPGSYLQLAQDDSSSQQAKDDIEKVSLHTEILPTPSEFSAPRYQWRCTRAVILSSVGVLLLLTSAALVLKGSKCAAVQLQHCGNSTVEAKALGCGSTFAATAGYPNHAPNQKQHKNFESGFTVQSDSSALFHSSWTRKQTLGFLTKLHCLRRQVKQYTRHKRSILAIVHT